MTFKRWIQQAYPPHDVPLLHGHRPRSIILDTAQTIEVRYVSDWIVLTIVPDKGHMKLLIGERH